MKTHPIQTDFFPQAQYQLKTQWSWWSRVHVPVFPGDSRKHIPQSHRTPEQRERKGKAEIICDAKCCISSQFISMAKVQKNTENYAINTCLAPKSSLQKSV